MQLLEKLKLLLGFGGEQTSEDAVVNEIVDKSFSRLRNVNPETHQQWLRLQRSIVEKAADVPTRSRPMAGFAFAAAVVAFAIVGGYFYFISLQPSPERFATGKGQQKEVVLNDGSQVTLNYATELVVSRLRKGKSRRLSLTGEAYFRVEKNDAPFIVSTRFAEVRVLGTEFNVRAREGGLEVAVIGGIVKVSVVKDGKDSSLVLSRHEMALCPQDDYPKRVGNVPSPEYPGWMHDKLFFNRTSFLEACREIEMQFDVTINVQDRNFGEEKITGVLGAKTAESALTALCELVGKRFSHEGNAYTVY